MPTDSVRVFAPGSVSNLACGFDVFGLALEGPGDEIVARPSAGPGVSIVEVTGDDGRVPRSVAGNSAGAAARALLDRLDADAGVELSLHKGLPLASGLGGSGASAVAAVVAVDRLLGAGRSREELFRCALEGERAACGAAHGDNVAPALYGGWVLVRSAGEADVVSLPVPRSMSVAVVRPHLEVETAGARRALGEHVRLSDAVTQWANTAALVAGLFREDWDLISRSLVDVVAEPVRARAVPAFGAVRAAAVDAGALGCNLSGSGPSVFALCRSREEAERAGEAMREALREEGGVEAELYVSPAGAGGARVADGPAA